MALSPYMQSRRAKAMGISQPTAPKEKKSIPKKSAKRIESDKEYKKVSKELKIKSDGKCNVRSPICTGKAQGMNHKQKTSPNNRTDKLNLTPCCNACNGYLESHPDWAEKHGHQISRFKIPDSSQIPEDDPDDIPN